MPIRRIPYGSDYAFVLGVADHAGILASVAEIAVQTKTR